MKITHIGHACALIEANGVAVLSDPWWKGPCFGAQWWIYPLPYLDPVATVRIDYIYISHGHHDHLHTGTLRTLPRTAIVLVSATLGLAIGIRALGFEVTEIGPDEELTVGEHGDVRIRIMPTHGDDTMMGIADGDRVALNVNDALHSAPRDVQEHHVAALKKRYATLDYVLCGYGIASHFPNCYAVPGKDSGASAILRQRYFNRQWAWLMNAMQPRYAFPFAADVVFLEDALFWANEPTHNGERPTAAQREAYPDTRVVGIDMAPGFVIDGDHIERDVRRVPTAASAVREGHADGMRRANSYGSTSADAVDEVCALLRERVERLQDALATCPADYRMLIALHNSRRQVAIVKRGRRITVDTVDDPVPADFDIVYRTRLAYLKWALTERFGDELLFVGSGGQFEYASKALALCNVHRELIGLIRDDVPFRPRQRRLERWYRRARRAFARALGRPKAIDLYDLGAWTVFPNARPSKENA